MHHATPETEVVTAAEGALFALRSRQGPSVVISNEVGMGIVPMNDLARSYRDVLGRVNQLFVAASAEAYLMVAGRALMLTDIEEP